MTSIIARRKLLAAFVRFAPGPKRHTFRLASNSATSDVLKNLSRFRIVAAEWRII